MAHPIRTASGKATTRTPPIGRVVALATALATRAEFARHVGLTFGGHRDLYRVLGYERNVRPKHYRDRYERGGLAERIVNAYPKATWSGGARIAEDVEPNVFTPFEEAVNRLFERHNLWGRITRADILANLGRYSIILIGAPGAINSPMPKSLNGPDDIRYFTCLGEERASIVEYDQDDTSERFGLPVYYELKLGPEKAPLSNSKNMTPRRVHWTRIIHVAEGLLEDDIFGTPRLRAVWNYLDDLEKLVGGGAEAAWKRMDPGMQIDIDPEIEMTEDEEEALEDEVEAYVHGESRFVKTRGTDINLLAGNVAGFGPNVNSVVQLLSGTTGIPQRILTGSERGELASTQDRLNWQDRINERRRDFGTPLIRQFIGRLIDHGVLPMPRPPQERTATQEEIAPGASTRPSDAEPSAPPASAEKALSSRHQLIAAGRLHAVRYLSHSLGVAGFEIVWPEVGQVDDKTKAETLGKIAAANQAQRNTGQPVILTSNEIRHAILGMGPLDPDTIQDDRLDRSVPGKPNREGVNGDNTVGPAPAIGTAGSPNPGGNL